MNIVPQDPSAEEAERFGASLWELRVPIHAYLARRSPTDADDLLVDVWVAAYTSRHTFDAARGDVRPWLFGVARNVLRAHLRRSRRPATPFRQRDTSGQDWEAVDERLDALSVAPELRAALAQVPPAEREVLLLVAWEGLSPTEAASVLGLRQGTARSRLHRARERLRVAMSERSTDDRTSEGQKGTGREGRR
ncbi:RNA polymerase sigma factor [Aeromicrobium senzhongii]|uniref:RNA polymerase sigma factor n=1 Tax=Aeromicrobium senzhongii TaxID=2663859 RepID=A0ABX6SUE3_9ACTN|nr:RNA polymerase sigma factor [Aeromicrobium senzhongii]MTB88653.1 sigma-70 family RNA polymerase sigma factor [Aeromicrobium senzhongii]QNL94044.1 RNA polymerase sigma factor [Aeromicrobium senzhongii]